jgi:hypothetical protein
MTLRQERGDSGMLPATVAGLSYYLNYSRPVNHEQHFQYTFRLCIFIARYQPFFIEIKQFQCAVALRNVQIELTTLMLNI